MSNTPQWTPSQKLAIDTRDRQVLVAASAGTGKTAVLSERVAQAVADPKGGVDIERILVLTFTEAAAEEMRARIAGRLRAEAKTRKDRALRSQLLRIDAAHISTIHAFCKRILDANFFEVGLDPCYSIIDEDERRLLKGDILRQVIDQAWADETLASDLPALLQDRTVKARGDDFLATIPRISDFLEGVVDAEQWLDLAESAPDWNNEGRNLIAACLSECQQRFAFAAHLDRTLAEGGYLTSQIETEYHSQVEGLLERLTKVDLSTWAADLQEFKWSNVKRKPKDLEEDTAEVIKQAVNGAKDSLKQLKAWTLCWPGSDAILDPLVRQQSRTLVTLVRRFRAAFTAAKRQRNCLDFADLEHGMLTLLQGHPTIAERLAQSFDLIFVDEYQDVNAVQQAILDCVGQRDNLFCVGDVKQSIYAFRQSRPEIFLGQLQQAQPEVTSDKEPLRVDLQANFRSRVEVLDFANVVFGRVMTEEVCSMAYDDKAVLIGGASYDPLPAGTAAVELAILDETEDKEPACHGEVEDEDGMDDVDLISAAQRQAAFIAERIRHLVEVERIEVLDRGTQTRRPVRYGDIVILMRSLSGRAPQMVEILRLAGIPVSSQATSGYFDALEISDMLSLLRVLDNPRRDVELAAVLRSALFGFSDSDLAAIRLADPQGGKGRSYYESVLVAEQSADDDLKQRLTTTLQQLQAWRSLSRQGSPAQLLWEVYRSTGYLAYVTALPNGAQRQANLLKLHDRAIQFEGFHEGALRSLSRFVEFVEKLLEEGGDWAPAEPDSAAEDAVRIMTIHRSKGLEFPVVFLAELNRSFNRMDSRGACLLHEHYGLGLQVVEPERRARFNSAAYEIIREQQKVQTLAEEMRILYVALTRARERLILCGSVKSDHCRKWVAQGAMISDGPLPGWMAAGADCHLDWLLGGLSHTRLLQERFLETSTGLQDKGLYQLHCLDREHLNQITQSILHLRNTRSQAKALTNTSTSKPPAWAQQIEESLAWTYPYAVATLTSAKQSVSALSHQDDEFSLLDVSRALEARPQVALKPSRTAQGDLPPDPRELGTAMHLVFETLPLEQPPTQASIQNHVESLVKNERVPLGLMGDDQIKAVHHFFQGPLGQQCLDPDNQVLREWPFTMRIPEPSGGDDFVVVQGIVDLIIVTPKGYLIIDFKTDRVKAQQVAERAKLYETQLKLYAQAVQGILSAADVRTTLYFLQPGMAVNMDLK